MFRIRQITDDSEPMNRRELEQVQQILRERLPGLVEDEISSLPERVRDPFGSQMQAKLLVADDLRGSLKGFALLSYAPDVNFCLLDYIASVSGGGGGGVGGALYSRVREFTRELGAIGLFFECLPDDPVACSNPDIVKSNAARLRFYERFGARPLIGIGYETPLKPGDLDMPHLVYDDVDTGRSLSRDDARAVVRAILERKYSHLCSPEYVAKVLAQIVDDPVRLRDWRYDKRRRERGEPLHVVAPSTGEHLVALVVNSEHQIHHVRERGYVEAPVRVRSILAGLEASKLFWRVEPREFPIGHVLAVHDAGFVEYLRKVCASVPAGKSIYPYVFPVRNATRPPKDLAYSAGYYCIDTFTPLNKNAWLAARRGVDCALTAADAVLSGQRFAYALVRPPGHHAERRSFGGFCYLNNNAIAAHYLSRHGKVAIVDVDYHHGNGQQDIFWERGDVLTISIHGHPRFAYPFFTGFAEETGAGAGAGCNVNLPLPEKVDGERYRKELKVALRRVQKFAPRFLVIALGLDTARRDPTGTWSLTPSDFVENGRMFASLGLPTLVVQEGGYRTVSLGANARSFFEGLTGAAPAKARSK